MTMKGRFSGSLIPRLFSQRSLVLGCSLVVLLCGAPLLKAQDNPEILATLDGIPAGWQILAINPDTGGVRKVSKLPTADN